jgi:hypothetical protein
VEKKAKLKNRRNHNKNVKEKQQRRKNEEKGKSFLSFKASGKKKTNSQHNKTHNISCLIHGEACGSDWRRTPCVSFLRF